MWSVLVGWAAAAEPTVLPRAAILVTVVDDQGDPLVGVSLLLDEQSLLSDAFGDALFRMEPGPHTLTVSPTGQQPVILPVTALDNRTVRVPVILPSAPEPPRPALTPDDLTRLREFLQTIPPNRSGSTSRAPPAIGVWVGDTVSISGAEEPPASIVVEHPRVAEATWDGSLSVRGLKPGRTWIWTTRSDGHADVQVEVVVTRPGKRP